MQQQERRFLGKLFAFVVDDVHETCVHQVLDVVHHRCTGDVERLGELAHVGDACAVAGEQVEDRRVERGEHELAEVLADHHGAELG